MRPIHLLLAVLVLAGALAALWFSIGTGRPEIYAGQGASSEAGRTRPLSESGSAAAGATGSEDEDATRRTALVAPPSADQPAGKTAQSDKPLLMGRVVAGPAGSETGVPGARVFASTGSGWIQLPLDLEPEGLPKNWVKVAETTTDAEGRYRLEDLKPGSLRLAARAAGYAPRYVDRLDLPDETEFSVPDIHLERGVVLSGKVVDREGRGIGRASLLVALDAGGEDKLVSIPGRGIPVATTADDGTFRIDELAAGPWHLLIDSPAHIVAEEEGRTERSGEEVTGLVFVLEYGLEIRGKVKASEGSLPPGFRITARQSQERDGLAQGPDEGSPADDSASRSRHAACAEDGSFILRGLQPGVRYRLTAWQRSEDESGWKRSTAVDPVQAFSGAQGVELTYKPESALVFRVLDDKSGAPLTELSVFAGIGRERILRDDKNEVLRQFPDGRVRVPELRVETGGKPVVLRVSAVGHEDYQKKDLFVQPGADLDLGELRLSPRATVSASLIDAASGAPIENGRVILATQTDEEIANYLRSPSERDFWHDPKITYGRSGSDGIARLTSMPGKQVTLRASAKGYLMSDPLHVLLGDGDQKIELRLARGAGVVVHVTDDKGHPVAGVGIAHRKPDTKQAEDGWYADAVERKTDADGIARFDALERGTHSFRVQDQQAEMWSDANEPRQPGWLDAVVGESGSTTLEFSVPARGGLFGHVREHASPLSGARLKLVEVHPDGEGDSGSWGGPNDPLSTVTNHEGTYRFENIRCGSYTLYVNHPARRMSVRFSVTVQSDPREQDFDLDVASIEGRVTDLEGRALAGVEVVPAAKQGANGDDQPYQMVVIEDDRGRARVNYEQSSRRSEKTDSSGRYVLRGLASEVPLVIQVQGDLVERAASPEITLAPDEVRRGVDFALRRAGSIEVRLVGNATDNNWFQARAIRIADGHESLVQMTYLGTWNRVQTIRGLPPGHYKIALSRGGAAQGQPAQEIETDVAAAETSHVSFQAK